MFSHCLYKLQFLVCIFVCLINVNNSTAVCWILSWDFSVMVQLDLNFTHTCRHMCMLAHFTCVKLRKLACARTVACQFDVRIRDWKHMQYMRDAHHNLTLGLLHYTCYVATGTQAVGNEMQLFFSWMASLYLCCNQYCYWRSVVLPNMLVVSGKEQELYCAKLSTA